MSEAILIKIKMSGAHIVIPGNKIQRLTQDVVIVAVKEAHEIGSDELTRVSVFADDINLNALILVVLVSHEAFPLQHECGIMGADGNWNLAPVVVGLAPVGSRPTRV